MNTKTERNWQLIVAGILFIIFGLVCAFFPGLTLASIAFIVGAAFVVSGVVNIATFIRDRDLLGFSGWILAYGILDVLIGAMFVIHPFAFAAVLPWVIGAFVLVFGIYEVVATFMVKRAGLPLWGWMLFSGVISIVIGFMFFSMPEMLALFIALFALLRGVDLIVMGANARKYFLYPPVLTRRPPVTPSTAHKCNTTETKLAYNRHS